MQQRCVVVDGWGKGKEKGVSGGMKGKVGSFTEEKVFSSNGCSKGQSKHLMSKRKGEGG